MNVDLIQNVLSNMARKEAEDQGIICLGEFIQILTSLNAPNLPIVFDTGEFPDEFDSYRGYYEMLALGTGEEKTTVGFILQEAKDAVGGTFDGYKGGEYTMSKMTPLWASDYGEASGRGITGCKVVNGVCVVQTCMEE